jgi:hypothetical protein
MGAACVLIGEAFLSSEGMDYEQGYLLLLVYTVLVFFFSFSMAYQMNSFMHYSGRKNTTTIRLFIHIMYISHDENRD